MYMRTALTPNWNRSKCYKYPIGDKRGHCSLAPKFLQWIAFVMISSLQARDVLVYHLKWATELASRCGKWIVL